MAAKLPAAPANVRRLESYFLCGPSSAKDALVAECFQLENGIVSWHIPVSLGLGLRSRIEVDGLLATLSEFRSSNFGKDSIRWTLGEGGVFNVKSL
ncbi:hypothetical protein Dimus_034260 [Dionaea muscipula]